MLKITHNYPADQNLWNLSTFYLFRNIPTCCIAQIHVVGLKTFLFYKSIFF